MLNPKRVSSKRRGHPGHVGVVSVGFLGDCKNHMFFFLQVKNLATDKQKKEARFFFECLI